MIGLWFQKSKWGELYKFILIDEQIYFKPFISDKIYFHLC